MQQFSAEGRRVARTTCPVTGGRHVPDPHAAQRGTFFCERCAAIPKDSVLYDMDERYAYDPQGPDPRREDHG